MEATSKCRVVIFTFRAARLSGPSGSLNHTAASPKEPNKFCPPVESKGAACTAALSEQS